MELVGSISIAERLEKPFTLRASLPNFWPNASDKLCATQTHGQQLSGTCCIRDILQGEKVPGSVLMRRTDWRTLASWTAREHDVVVLPTPPFPPQKIHFRDSWVSDYKEIPDLGCFGESGRGRRRPSSFW
jgi:hypothetical protein